MGHFDQPVPAFLDSVRSEVKLQGTGDPDPIQPRQQYLNEGEIWHIYTLTYKQKVTSFNPSTANILGIWTIHFISLAFHNPEVKWEAV